MKHYVVFLEWADESDNGSSILGVAHSLEEAREIFNETYVTEKELAEEKCWEIYEDCETEFNAGEDGYYVSNHTRLYIQEVI